MYEQYDDEVIENEIFDELYDRIYEVFLPHGKPFENSAGDFLVSPDYWGNKEVAVILSNLVFSEEMLRRIQAALSKVPMGWIASIAFDDEVKWKGHVHIEVGKDYWKPVKSLDLETISYSKEEKERIAQRTKEMIAELKEHERNLH